MSTQLVDLIMPTLELGKCRLRAYRPREGVVVAIFTELADNGGVSVTNSIAYLATQIRRGQMRQGEVLFVFEHHEFDGNFHLDRDGEYSLVQLVWEAERRRYHTPTWTYKTKQQVEQLIGEGL